MTDTFILLPTNIYYTKSAISKIIAVGIDFIYFIEDSIFVADRCKEYVICQIAAFRKYKEFIIDLIVTTNRKITVKYITDDVCTFLPKIKSRVWMFKQITEISDELEKIKPNGLPIEFYSSENCILSLSDLKYNWGADLKYNDFYLRFKQKLRGSTNDLIVDKQFMDNSKYYIAAKRVIKRYPIYHKLMNGKTANQRLPIDPHSAVKYLDIFLNNLSNIGRGKGEKVPIKFTFDEYISSDIANMLDIGLITPKTLASILKEKHSIYAALLIEYLCKHEYLIYMSYHRKLNINIMGKKNSFNIISSEMKMQSNGSSITTTSSIYQIIHILIKHSASLKSIYAFLYYYGIVNHMIISGIIVNALMRNKEKNLFIK